MPTEQSDAQLLRDIEEHMRKMWDARLLPAVCWPADLAQRLTQAVRRAPAAPVPHTAPCLECERCGLPPINHNLSHWCDSQSFAAAPQPSEAEENPLQEQLDEALQSLEFYKRRCDLLQSIQPHMRDPERTMVCDVLANGHLLQGGDGQPDKARYALPEAAPVRKPLSDGALDLAYLRDPQIKGEVECFRAGARYAEAFHGIKGA